ncbi:HlyD family secretion protein [Francisellaceae bacterium]|jgi:multidrug resistance efflux pump|nr:HlyD family secretion protein [Francisellaceae bacterium]
MYIAWKKHLNFTNIIVAIGVAILFIYVISFLLPFTDNAFVVNNVRPVVAEVSGYVTEIHVKNGDYVKKGQPLFKVLDDPYRYAHNQATANLKDAQAKLESLEHTLQRDIEISNSRQKIYEKIKLDDDMYQAAYKIRAVSAMVARDSIKDTKASLAEYNASLRQIEIDKKEIKSQVHKIESLQAELDDAKFYLDQTIVYAQRNGIIQNFYLTLGNPVNFNEPLFSIVTTDEVLIQANFEETDLRFVHPGDKVLIFPRTYLFQKVFHGEVISDYWGANRQYTDNRTQLQDIKNENQWLLIPQRLPVQIRVTDPDPEYPLRVGSSAYVYIDIY